MLHSQGMRFRQEGTNVKVYHANSHENIKYKVVVHAGKYVKLFDGVISATSSNGHGAGVLLVATFSYDPQTGITDVAGGATGRRLASALTGSTAADAGKGGDCHCECGASGSEEEEADSILKEVQAAGGSVSGKMGISLAWSENCDLDLHVKTPNGNEIDYQNKEEDGGKLDLDQTSCQPEYNQTVT